MHRTGFKLYPTSDECLQDLRMVFVDNKGSSSPTITSFRTLYKLDYNLDPCLKKPWFKILDAGDGKTVYGSWIDHPFFSPKEIIQTSHIIEAKTSDGDVIDTWIHTSDPPTSRHVFNTTTSTLFSQALH